MLGRLNVDGSRQIDWGGLSLKLQVDGNYRPVSSLVQSASTPKDVVRIIVLKLIWSHAKLFSRMVWCANEFTWESDGKRQIPMMKHIRNFVKVLDQLLRSFGIGCLRTGPGGGGDSFGRGPIIALLRLHFRNKVTGKFTNDWLVWNWVVGCRAIAAGCDSVDTIPDGSNSGAE